MTRMQENTDRDLGPDLRGDPQRVHGALGAAVDRARPRKRPHREPDHHLVQGLAPAHLIAVYRELARRTDAAAAPRAHRSRHGHEGPRLVGDRDRRAAQRRHRRHDPRVADAAPRRRPPRRGLRVPARSCRRSACAPSRRRSPPARAAGARPAPPSRNSPSACRGYIRERMPTGRCAYEGVETLTLAVMGCVVNGPGESKAANIGISLPGTGEAPTCPVFIDGNTTR
jgi:hypothetical protein